MSRVYLEGLGKHLHLQEEEEPEPDLGPCEEESQRDKLVPKGAADLTHQLDCGRYATMPYQDQSQLQGVHREQERQDAHRDCGEG